MNKYDYGEEILSGSTLEWVFDNIENNSRILELGSNNGLLVKHLVFKKNCVADIVEIDDEYAHDSVTFTKNACIGKENGDLEKSKWFEIIQNEKYDYIILLDILEHIRNAKEVLEKAKSLLKENGEIFLSIPNIAHNSIIISLLNNNFNYSNVGLLDETHICFYTYTSINKLLNSIGLYSVREEVRQIKVGENEIAASYENVPYVIEHFLRNREYGSAYQYLFTIKKQKPEREVNLEYIIDQPYVLTICDNENVSLKKYIEKGKIIEEKIDLANFDTNILNVSPLNFSCIIEELCIIGCINDEEIEKIDNFTHNGVFVEDRIMFFNDNPKIMVELVNKYSSIKLKYVVTDIGWANVNHLENVKQYIDLLGQSKVQLEENNKLLNSIIQELENKNNLKEIEYNLKEIEYNLKEIECKDYRYFFEQVLANLNKNKLKRFIYKKRIEELNKILNKKYTL